MIYKNKKNVILSMMMFLFILAVFLIILPSTVLFRYEYNVKGFLFFLFGLFGFIYQSINFFKYYNYLYTSAKIDGNKLIIYKKDRIYTEIEDLKKCRIELAYVFKYNPMIYLKNYFPTSMAYSCLIIMDSKKKIKVDYMLFEDSEKFVNEFLSIVNKDEIIVKERLFFRIWKYLIDEKNNND